MRGMGPPVPQAGVVGDLYIDVQTWRLYEKRANDLTSPWGNYLFIVPDVYRTGLKWFSASAPSNFIGVPGDYCLLWGTYANYGVRPSIFGPKNAYGWPENGDGGTIPIAAPGLTVLQIGLVDPEGPALPESINTQLIAVGLLDEVILTRPIDDAAGAPVQSVGLQSGPLQIDVTVNNGFDALNLREV